MVQSVFSSCWALNMLVESWKYSLQIGLIKVSSYLQVIRFVGEGSGVGEIQACQGWLDLQPRFCFLSLLHLCHFPHPTTIHGAPSGLVSSSEMIWL